MKSKNKAEAAPAQSVQQRLEYLRGELRAERISYGELSELQSLAQHIAPGDVELLQAAGVPEDGMSNHTPLPWHLTEPVLCEDSTGKHATQQLVNESSHAALMLKHDGSSEGFANAEYAQKACNLHEELLAALENLEAIAGLMNGRQDAGCAIRADDWSELYHCCIVAKAVIAKAEGRDA